MGKVRTIGICILVYGSYSNLSHVFIGTSCIWYAPAHHSTESTPLCDYIVYRLILFAARNGFKTEPLSTAMGSKRQSEHLDLD